MSNEEKPKIGPERLAGAYGQAVPARPEEVESLAGEPFGIGRIKAYYRDRAASAAGEEGGDDADE